MYESGLKAHWDTHRSLVCCELLRYNFHTAPCVQTHGAYSGLGISSGFIRQDYSTVNGERNQHFKIGLRNV